MYDNFFAIFGHFGTKKHLKHKEYTNCNYLGEKVFKKKYMKVIW